MKTPHKQLLALLSLDVLFALLIGLLGTRVGFSLKTNTLTVGLHAVTGPYGRDSWKPMLIAWKYWIENNKAVAIYSDLLIRDHIKFQYPPNTLFLPKLILESSVEAAAFYTIATRVFLAVTIMAVAAVAFYSLKSFGQPLKSPIDKLFSFVLIGVLTVIFYPIAEACSLGQSQAWLNALFAAALLCYMTGRMTLAGIIIGIMASFKPQYALFIVWGMMRGNWRLALATLITGVVIVIIGISEFGLATYFDYLKALGFLSQHGEAFMANQSVNGLLNRFFSIGDPESYNNTYWRGRYFPPFNSWVYFGTLISSVVIVALCLFGKANKEGFSSYVDFGLMALGATMASPIAWEHHYGILLPILALLWPLFWFSSTSFNSRWFQVIFLGLYLLSSNLIPFVIITAPTYLNIAQSYLLFAAAGIFLLLLKVRHAGNVAV